MAFENAPFGPGFFIFFTKPQTSGSGSGISSSAVIYDEVPKKVVKKVVKRVIKAKSKGTVSRESIEKIVNEIVGSISQEEIKLKMDLYDISQEIAIMSYRKTLLSLVNDEDLAIILIIASI